MASTAQKAGITQFAGEGFDTWLFRVETQLAAHGVKKAIVEDPPADGATAEVKASFEERDEKAKALIVSYIADSHLEHVRDMDSAKEMWSSLKRTFGKTNPPAK